KINFDITPHYTAGTGERDVSSETDKNGNNKIGGAAYGVIFEAGLKFERFQIKGLFNVTTYADSKLKPSGATQEERSTFETGGQVQFNLNPKWLFNFLFTYTNTDSHKIVVDS